MRSILSFVKARNNRMSKAANNEPKQSYGEPLERCIVCGVMTDVPVSRPVNERKWYVPGGGQMCRTCCIELYGTDDLRSLQSSDMDQMFLNSFQEK